MSRVSRCRAGGIAPLATLLACPVLAQAPLDCPAPPPIDAWIDPLPPLGEDLPPDTIRLESGETEFAFGGRSRLTGGVRVRRGDYALQAESAEFDPLRRHLSLEGDVSYLGAGTAVMSEGADFSYEEGRIRFDEAEFRLAAGRGRGEAGVLRVDAGGKIRLESVSYTGCPVGKDDWEIRAGKIRLDTAAGVGEARNLRLEFQGVPILFAPYLSFPLTDARKTGFLVPGFGQSSRGGTDISIPYYWNIAPRYDATFTPRILTERGLQLDSQFRFLTRHSRGELNLEYLPDDNEAGRDRTFVSVFDRTVLAGWRTLVDVRHVSDDAYFEDLGGSLSSASLTHLDRSITFDRPGEHWYLLARLQRYQTLESDIPELDEPYRRLPQLAALGRWPELTPWLSLFVEGELVRFDREVGATGWRLDTKPTLELPFGGEGLHFTPGLGYEYTRYALDEQPPTVDDDPDRALPIFSLDTGATFERPVANGRGWRQTLEPRVLYVHIPFRAQDDLPVFDTIEPDFNLVQIFRKNQFQGIDRIADTDQLSIGLTSRIIDEETGRELLSGTIGQTRYLSSQGVALPGGEPITADSSDFVAELGVNLYDNWNLEIGQQWNSEASETVKSEFRLQYAPGENRVLNLGYRFRRGSVEQSDVSLSWPLARRWNLVGRHNYSLRDDRTLEYFVGLEYESCCWGIRLVSRRYISRRDGTADASVALQLELKGLTSVGDPADQLLERGILGYSARN